MPDFDPSSFSGGTFAVSFLLTSFAVVLIVAIHYESLTFIQRLLPKLHVKPRLRIGYGVMMALCTHSLQCWVFAVFYWLYIDILKFGHLVGGDGIRFLDYVYFSFVSYTTVGFGDLVPHGHVRFLSNMESLTGFVVITWTASFLFMEMERHWRERR